MISRTAPTTTAPTTTNPGDRIQPDHGRRHATQAGDHPVRSIPGHHCLRLQILGPLRLWRGGAEVDAGPRQQAYLLALLLARVGRPTSTAELIDLIWGDDVPASALNVIH